MSVPTFWYRWHGQGVRWGQVQRTALTDGYFPTTPVWLICESGVVKTRTTTPITQWVATRCEVRRLLFDVGGAFSSDLNRLYIYLELKAIYLELKAQIT